MNKLYVKLALLAVLMVGFLAPGLAFAADSGDDNLGLGELLDWLVALLQGPLGKICALVAFTVGMIAGIARGSFLAVLTGVGFAVVFYYGPNIILNVFGAVL
jgi:type IV secretory pathway VirB2 component (pilin)